jgi:hypothetical protein
MHKPGCQISIEAFCCICLIDPPGWFSQHVQSMTVACAERSRDLSPGYQDGQHG